MNRFTLMLLATVLAAALCLAASTEVFAALAPAPPDSRLGEIHGSSAQAAIQCTAFQFQMLSRRMQNAGAIDGRAAFNAVGFEQPGRSDRPRWEDLADGGQPVVRAQGSAVTSGAWATSYAIGSDVEPTPIAAGINYDANGVQLGLYRWANFDTLYGIFGGYADQDVDTILGDKAAMVDSGQLGLFLRRGDMDRYWLLAASVAYDSYHMERAIGLWGGTTSTANGDFSGMQTSAYIERALSVCVRGSLLQPSCALQYTSLHQDDFAETGYVSTNVSPLTFDEANTSSLRSIIGVRISRERRMHSGLIVCAPELRAHWMHEYLDDTTTVAIANQSFPATSTGVSLGRDWAVLGVGFAVGFGDTFSLFADYDLQLNDRASLQVGSFGAQCEW